MYFIVMAALDGKVARFSTVLLSVFIMAEILYAYKVRKTSPPVTVSDNRSNPYLSFTYQALDALFFARKIEDSVRLLLTKKHVRFILAKAHITPGEIPLLSVEKETVARYSLDIVRHVGGKYVTRMDIFIAYLFLIEEQTKLLVSHHIHPDEMLHILSWARMEYYHEEYPGRQEVAYRTGGMFDSWTTGWTRTTLQYIRDITAEVLRSKPVLLGRKREYAHMIDALGKPIRNNVILVGEVGTGKTSLVEAFALNSVLGLTPRETRYKRVYELMLGKLISGVESDAALQARIEEVMTEIEHAGNIVVFLPDIEQILGNTTFRLDLSSALIPHLKKSSVPFVVTATPEAYQQYVVAHQTFADMFEMVTLLEPPRDEVVMMLLQQASTIEDRYRVQITYKAVIKAVDLAQEYFADHMLPGSAVGLLNSTASSVAHSKIKIVDEGDIIAKVEEMTHGHIAPPDGKEREQLLHLETSLAARVIGQSEATSQVAQAILRKRTGIGSAVRPLSFLFLGPTGVGKTETARALASLYFEHKEQFIRLDMSEYMHEFALETLLNHEQGSFIQKVHENPFSLILLDEIEKAHPKILDVFLQVLDDGRLTDREGLKVSFASTIIIATSNAGSDMLLTHVQQHGGIKDTFQKDFLHALIHEGIFRAEFINRFDSVVLFHPLTQEEIMQIGRQYLDEISKRLSAQNITFTYDASALESLSYRGFDPAFGARPMRRYIQHAIEDAMAKQMLEGRIRPGMRVVAHSGTNGIIELSHTNT
jgi:ATP-dependent Clp protease ATP-binding subunit ClpA